VYAVIADTQLAVNADTFLACHFKLPTEQRRKKMNYKEAKELVKERAGTKYTDGTLRLLEKMVGGLYRKNKEAAPIENVRVTRRVQRLCLWSGVQTRQLHTMLKSLDEVVEVVSRKGGSITYTLNLQPLTELTKTVDVVKQREKNQKADRAAKARVQRRTNRQAERVADCAKLMREMRPRFFASILRPSRTLPGAAPSAFQPASVV
jgi:hypothetical protein